MRAKTPAMAAVSMQKRSQQQHARVNSRFPPSLPLHAPVLLLLAILHLAASEPSTSLFPTGPGPARHLIRPPPLKLSPSKLRQQQQIQNLLSSSAPTFQSAQTSVAVAETADNSSTVAAPEEGLLKIGYWGGPVLVNPITVYLIFYGPKWRRRTRAVLKDFISSITTNTRQPSVRGWWGTLGEYTDGSGRRVSQVLRFGAEIRDRTASIGSKPKEKAVEEYIRKTIGHGTLPFDPNGMYLFLTDETVKVKGFCDEYCGSHFFIDNIPGKAGKVVFCQVGNPTRCPQGLGICTRGQNDVSSPNGLLGMDAMVWNLAHEMAEMATDPTLDGWLFPVEGLVEVSDMCQARTPPHNFSCGDHCVYNVYGHNRRRFWLPSIWSRDRQTCVVQAQDDGASGRLTSNYLH